MQNIKLNNGCPPALGRPGVRAARNWTGKSRARRCRSEEHTSELQSLFNLVCRLLLEKKNQKAVPE